jgi:hypothetical protein
MNRKRRVVRYIESPLATRGDLQYWDGSNWVSLSIGSTGEVLTTHDTGNPPTWEEIDLPSSSSSSAPSSSSSSISSSSSSSSSIDLPPFPFEPEAIPFEVTVSARTIDESTHMNDFYLSLYGDIPDPLMRRDGSICEPNGIPYPNAWMFGDFEVQDEAIWMAIEDDRTKNTIYMSYELYDKEVGSNPELKNIFLSISDPFSLTNGSINVTLPDVSDNNLYISGNGPCFFKFYFDRSIEEVSYQGWYWDGSQYISISETQISKFGTIFVNLPNYFSFNIISQYTPASPDYPLHSPVVFYNFLNIDYATVDFAPAVGTKWMDIRNAGGGRFGGIFYDILKEVGLFRDGRESPHPDLLRLGYTGEDLLVGDYGFYAQEGNGWVLLPWGPVLYDSSSSSYQYSSSSSYEPHGIPFWPYQAILPEVDCFNRSSSESAGPNGWLIPKKSYYFPSNIENILEARTEIEINRQAVSWNALTNPCLASSSASQSSSSASQPSSSASQPSSSASQSSSSASQPSSSASQPSSSASQPSSSSGGPIIIDPVVFDGCVYTWTQVCQDAGQEVRVLPGGEERTYQLYKWTDMLFEGSGCGFGPAFAQYGFFLPDIPCEAQGAEHYDYVYTEEDDFCDQAPFSPCPNIPNDPRLLFQNNGYVVPALDDLCCEEDITDVGFVRKCDICENWWDDYTKNVQDFVTFLPWKPYIEFENQGGGGGSRLDREVYTDREEACDKAERERSNGLTNVRVFSFVDPIDGVTKYTLHGDGYYLAWHWSVEKNLGRVPIGSVPNGTYEVLTNVRCTYESFRSQGIVQPPLGVGIRKFVRSKAVYQWGPGPGEFESTGNTSSMNYIKLYYTDEDGRNLTNTCSDGKFYTAPQPDVEYDDCCCTDTTEPQWDSWDIFTNGSANCTIDPDPQFDEFRRVYDNEGDACEALFALNDPDFDVYSFEHRGNTYYVLHDDILITLPAGDTPHKVPIPMKLRKVNPNDDCFWNSHVNIGLQQDENFCLPGNLVYSGKENVEIQISPSENPEWTGEALCRTVEVTAPGPNAYTLVTCCCPNTDSSNYSYEKWKADLSPSCDPIVYATKAEACQAKIDNNYAYVYEFDLDQTYYIATNESNVLDLRVPMILQVVAEDGCYWNSQTNQDNSCNVYSDDTDVTIHISKPI